MSAVNPHNHNVHLAAGNDEYDEYEHQLYDEEYYDEFEEDEMDADEANSQSPHADADAVADEEESAAGVTQEIQTAWITHADQRTTTVPYRRRQRGRTRFLQEHVESEWHGFVSIGVGG